MAMQCNPASSRMMTITKEMAKKTPLKDLFFLFFIGELQSEALPY